MKQYDGISLCTGILGFELGMVAAEIANHINIRQCVEINPYCQELIRLRLPGVPIWNDLTTYVPPIDLEPDRSVIWSGFPCQPVSQAGKQRGDKDKRYLWPYILRLIRQVRPVVWVGENVSGLRTIDSGRLFRGILEDLSRSGYCVEWSCVSASEVGAVHKRERVWLVACRPEAIADADSFRCIGGASFKRKHQDFLHQEWDAPENQQSRSQWLSGTDPVCAVAPHSEDIGCERKRGNIATKTRTDIASLGSGAEFADTASQGHQGSVGEGISGAGWQSQLTDRVADWHQDAQSFFCGGNAGDSSSIDRYLLRHSHLDEWLTASTIPTFSRLSSAEIGSLSSEDRQEYKQLLAEYHRTKRQYECWLEALGNAICPQQAAIVWRRVGQILGL